MMKRVYLFALFMALGFSVLTALTHASTGNIPIDKTRRDYRVYTLEGEAESGSQRFFEISAFTTRLDYGRLDGATVLVYAREDRSAEGDKYDWEFTFDPVDYKLLKIHRDIVTRDGVLIDRQDQFYKGHFFAYTPDHFHFQMLPLVVSRMNLTPGTVKDYQLVFSPEHQPIRIRLTVDGDETVTVAAGTFNCTRIKLEYGTESLPGIFKLIPSYLLKTMLSDYVLWVDKNKPHAMIKFQGKLEGMAGPVKVQELVKEYK